MTIRYKNRPPLSLATRPVGPIAIHFPPRPQLTPSQAAAEVANGIMRDMMIAPDALIIFLAKLAELYEGEPE
ncbi:hypothetical protein ASG17_12880 [Brevundimonas sp. Leaf363]|uniref:hypothetical protein n=1 Tax=Brevundimonas sp. Leaf363 TaxID=1736353 RepID=UPI0006F51BEF|nr:hypothetical protein [Brevundimonas sp. Leaf363]KQS53854.1 hypothetical protein ASG17_12880 [Brevundimonas sp. Leaf363]